MKRTLRFGMGVLALTGLLAMTAPAQSLGEIARQQRAQKPSTTASVKQYTNDNLPTSGGLSEVGQPTPPTSAKAAAAEEKADQKKKEDRSKLENEWKAKFAEQKNNISVLQRELGVLVQENERRYAA